MNTFKFLVSRVRYRAKQVEQELFLLREQLKLMDQSVAIDRERTDLLLYTFKIYETVQSMYTAYLSKTDAFVPYHLTTAVSCHLQILSELRDQFDDAITSICENQTHMIEQMGMDRAAVMKQLTGVDSGVSDVVSMLSVQFPYKEILELARNGSFVKDVLKRILVFEPKKDKDPKDGISRKTVSEYEDCCMSVFRMIGSLKEKPKFNEITNTFIAEFIVSFFLGELVRDLCTDYLQDFERFEVCRLLVKLRLEPLRIKPELMERLTQKEMRETPFNGNDSDKRPNELQFEPDTESVIHVLRYVVLQIRRVTTQVSVSSMYSILFEAIRLLNLTLSTNGQIIGADENFQFFVAAVSDAKLCSLPSLVRLLENFTLSSLRTSKTQFIVTHFGICEEFIKTRQMPVPPEILLPYWESPIPGLERVDETPIKLRGFVMYAVPTFVRSSYPMIVSCSGSTTANAVVYRYRNISSGKVLPNDFELCGSPTMSGLLMHIEAAQAAQNHLIRIDDPKMLTAGFSDTIVRFSHFLVMCNEEVSHPRIDQFTELAGQFAKKWSRVIQGGRLTTNDIITEIQNALKKKGILTDFKPGVLCYNTKCAIETVIPSLKKSRFFIDVRIWRYICPKEKREVMSRT